MKTQDGARDRSRRAHVLTAPIEGGVVHQVLDLVRFDPVGPCDVVLPPWPGLDGAAGRLASCGAHVHRLLPAPRAGGVTAWLAGRPVDLVHVHFASEHDGTPAVEAALAHGVQVVSTDHVCAVAGGDGEWAARRRAAASQAAILADSHAVAAALVAHLGREVRVLVHGIDVARFARCPPPTEARERLGIAPEASVVGSIGALFSHKGMHRIVRAAACLGPDTVVLIAGEGPERPRLEILARDLGVRLRLPGWLEDVRPALAAMDVFALASDGEGLPTGVLQAMAAGVPVVATDVGGVGEALGACGHRLPPADHQALVRAIEEVLAGRDGPEASRMRTAARRRVARRFDSRRLAAEVAAVHCAALGLVPAERRDTDSLVTRRRIARPARAASRGSN